MCALASDDTARVSDSTRLLEQLMGIHRCIHLSAFSGSAIPVLDETRLKLSLHTLSRAIEIEANAYCEALWLLYLHLSSLLPKRDYEFEFEMTEQANQFIPSSHRLWVHYMMAGKLESINFSESLHSRVLCHVATPGTFQGHDNEEPNLSGLLTAIVIHLCIKLHGAGRTRRSLELLSALLRIKTSEAAETAPSIEWCKVVRDCMSWSDLAVLSMVYAHLLLFEEVPSHIHKWLRVSGDQQVHIQAFGYTVETFEGEGFRSKQLPLGDLRAAVASYRGAFDLIDQSDGTSRQYLDVVVNNRLILEAFLDARAGSEAAGFDDFVHDHRGLVMALPGSSFAAANLLLVGCDSSRSALARQLMLDMLNQSAVEVFPEALHFYLCALRGFEEAFSAATVAQLYVDIDVVVRLSASVNSVDQVELAKSVVEVKSEANPFAKVKALKRLLFGLFIAWMDQLAVASHRDEAMRTHAGEPRTVDVYVALAICQLMSVLLDPSVAIEAVELVLQSSKLKNLNAESRQLMWSLRFILEMEATTHEQAEPRSTQSSKAVRTALLQLFRRYMEGMNLATESAMITTDRVSNAVARDGIQTAIFECLYPQHSPWLLLDENLALFTLCASSIPEFELPSHFRSYHCWLSPSPEFCVSYAGMLMLRSTSLAPALKLIHDGALVVAQMSRRSIGSGGRFDKGC